MAGRRELGKWFNTALSVHLAMAIMLCLLMYPVGLYFIRYKLVIPNALLASSEQVFAISIVTTFFAILNIPFHALYTAKQLIFVRNFFGIFQTLLCALEGWWLLHFNGNRLVAHSLATSVLLVSLYCAMAALAFGSFTECRVRWSLWYNRARLRELFSYSLYMLIGSVGRLLSGPGINIVLNIFFGPSINAVMGIGRHVASKVSMLSEAIVSAVSPEVTSRVGAQDLKRAESLGVDVCYVSAVISILVFVPLVFWLQPLLDLWLRTPPSGAAFVAVLMILESAAIKATSGYVIMIQASGRIKEYQIFVGMFNMSCVLILWMLLEVGCPLFPALATAWLGPRMLISVGVVFFARWLLGVPICIYISRVLIRSVILGGASVIVCMGLSSLSESLLWGGGACVLGNFLIVVPLSVLLLGKSRRRMLWGRIAERLRRT